MHACMHTYIHTYIHTHTHTHTHTHVIVTRSRIYKPQLVNLVKECLSTCKPQLVTLVKECFDSVSEIPHALTLYSFMFHFFFTKIHLHQSVASGQATPSLFLRVIVTRGPVPDMKLDHQDEGAVRALMYQDEEALMYQDEEAVRSFNELNAGGGGVRQLISFLTLACLLSNHRGYCCRCTGPSCCPQAGASTACWRSAHWLPREHPSIFSTLMVALRSSMQPGTSMYCSCCSSRAPTCTSVATMVTRPSITLLLATVPTAVQCSSATVPT